MLIYILLSLQFVTRYYMHSVTFINMIWYRYNDFHRFEVAMGITF